MIETFDEISFCIDWNDIVRAETFAMFNDGIRPSVPVVPLNG